MSRRIITLTTDFGTGSSYVAQMKAAILVIQRDAVLVDIAHSIPPQDIRCGALVLAETVPRFPEQSIHVAVVDPGVGTSRSILLSRIENRFFIAPDNGLISGLTRNQPPELMVHVTDDRWWNSEVSPTFHGRDIMAPVAAHLSLGTAPQQFGEIISEFLQLDWPIVVPTDSGVEGSITTIDAFGNLISDIHVEWLPEKPSQCVVSCGEFTIQGIVGTYADRAPSELVALIGSAGCLEVAQVHGNASSWIGVDIGDPIRVSWDE